ncbi:MULTISPECIES: ABC transporter ATP-binding protein [Heyndrickxia]|nr:ABC transporter ATP-binding protein [Heyndrickxia shackletonii]
MNKLISVPYYYYEIPSFYNHQYRILNNYGSRFLRPVKNLVEAVQNIISIVSYISFLYFIHWSLIFLGVVVAIPTLVIQYKYGNKKFAFHKDQSGKLREANYIIGLFGSKQSTKEIRLFKLRDKLLQRWKEIVLTNNKKYIRILNKQNRLSVGIDAFSGLLYALALVLIVYVIKIKKLSVGNFVTTIQSLKELQFSVNRISFLVALILESSLYIKDFFEFIDYEIDNKGTINEKIQLSLDNSRSIFSKGISVENLYYKYPLSDTYTLNNISFVIKPKEKVAIVGDNGSGKSTLIKILVGLYQPTQGKIFFSEKEIREIKDDDLRKNMTAIFQDFVKFAYSVKENIAFSDLDNITNEEKIKNVGLISGVDKLVEKLPKGYDTNLGKILPNSIDISGGEWQKIALSRALFKNSNIIILDEPTASLDPKSELSIFNQFMEIVKEKTAIFISHRMASARMADRIIVMKQGEIVEEGSHEYLMKKKGEYYNMYESQASWYQ